MKESRLFITRFLSRESLNRSDNFKCGDFGLPLWLLKIINQKGLLPRLVLSQERLDIDYLLIKTLLTVLALSRAFTLKSEPDTGSIESESEATNFENSISNDELRSAAMELGFKS
jgi:hypothetical protein